MKFIKRPEVLDEIEAIQIPENVISIEAKEVLTTLSINLFGGAGDYIMSDGDKICIVPKEEFEKKYIPLTTPVNTASNTTLPAHLVPPTSNISVPTGFSMPTTPQYIPQ